MMDIGSRSVDRDRAAQERRIARVAGRPHAFGEQNDRNSSGTVVRGYEAPSRHRGNAQGPERVGRDVAAVDAVRRASLVAHGERRGNKRGQIDERLLRGTEILEVQPRHTPVCAPVVERRDVQHALHLVEGQPLQGVRVDEREEHVVDADADGEHH
jgi:hypothetical protein